ncbi:hypothetical protein JCM8097_003117 [Rhodosporidiobolus ruineniae]
MSDVDFPAMSASQEAATLLMGPSQVGYQVQILVYGLFAALFIQYCSSGELARHNRTARAALWISLFLNTFYTGFCFYEAYIAAVSQDRTYFNLANSDAVWNVLPMLNGVITALTEGYLASRAGALIPSKSLRIVFWIWMAALIAVVLFGSAVTTADGVFYLQGAEDGSLAISYNSANSIWLWASAVADISISSACAYGLMSRVASFNVVTDSLLRRLTLIVVRTAAYTSLLSIVGAICLVIWSDDNNNAFIPIALWLPMPALYGLSLFTFSAGSRRAIDSRFNGNSNAYQPNTSATPRKTRPLSFPRSNRNSAHERGGPVPLRIAVQQSEEIMYDEPTSEEETSIGLQERKSGLGRGSNLGRDSPV